MASAQTTFDRAGQPPSREPFILRLSTAATIELSTSLSRKPRESPFHAVQRILNAIVLILGSRSSQHGFFGN